MAHLANLADFRLLRALRGGQPGAFPNLWNAQAGAIWSVVRALCPDDATALGWMASFRLDLSEQAQGFDATEPVAPQVGLALCRHLAPHMTEEGPLPRGPLSPDEAGLELLPRFARLLYLLTLFFDVPEEALVGVAGEAARPVLRGAVRAFEPVDDTDAHLLTHAALLRNPPAAALLLPPGTEPAPPPRGRWGWLAFAGLLSVALLATPFLRDRVVADPYDVVAAQHLAVLSGGSLLLASEPAALSARLLAGGLPPELCGVPDLEPLGLGLWAGRAEWSEGAEVVLVYASDEGLWTLAHRARPAPPAPRAAERVLARAQSSVGELRVVGVRRGVVQVVSWDAAGGSWALTAAAPPERMLEVAERVVSMGIAR